MPGMDGTGPRGLGPGTGGGFGRCGYGRRSGQGRGYAAGWADAQQAAGRPDAAVRQADGTQFQENAGEEKLLAELAEVKEQSANLEERLSELTEMVKKLARTEPDKSSKTAKPH